MAQEELPALSFTKGYGWQISQGMLHLSLGRGRPRIDLAIPEIVDSATGLVVPPDHWGEIQLCWDKDGRKWSLHVPYGTDPLVSAGDTVTAIDEGIINPMALTTWKDGQTICVTIINGKQGRVIKQNRNKSTGVIERKISRCKIGSKRHRRLVLAKKKVKAKARQQLWDFDHQLSRKAGNHVITHCTGRLIAGDVCRNEQKSKVEKRIGRHMRQQLSQWSKGTQERYLGEKTGLPLGYINESGSTKTCPACLMRNRPKGRHYRCKVCGFTCHRDTIGAINILQKAIHGTYLLIGTDTETCVRYLRATERWSPDQRNAHRKVQRRKARALSSAQNRALGLTPAKQTLATSSTGSEESGPIAEVA